MNMNTRLGQGGASSPLKQHKASKKEKIPSAFTPGTTFCAAFLFPKRHRVAFRARTRGSGTAVGAARPLGIGPGPGAGSGGAHPRHLPRASPASHPSALALPGVTGSEQPAGAGFAPPCREGGCSPTVRLPLRRVWAPVVLSTRERLCRKSCSKWVI